MSRTVAALLVILAVSSLGCKRKDSSVEAVNRDIQAQSIVKLSAWLAKGGASNVDEYGDLLRAAVASNNVAACKLLIARGRKIDVPDKNGYTALHLAARNGSTPIIQMLLDAGADVRARNGSGFTPLHVAIVHARFDAISLLASDKAALNCPSSSGETPMALAQSIGNSKIVDILKSVEEVDK